MRPVDRRRDAVASEASDAIAPGLDSAGRQMVEALSSVAAEAAMHVLRTPKRLGRSPSAPIASHGYLPRRDRGPALPCRTGGRRRRPKGSIARGIRPLAESCQIWLGEFLADNYVRSMNDSALTGIAKSDGLSRVVPTSTRLRLAADLLDESTFSGLCPTKSLG
jgi:hypothetical protein